MVANEWLIFEKFSTWWLQLGSRSSSHAVKAVDQAWGCHWDRFHVTLSPVNWSFNLPTTRVLLYLTSRAKRSISSYSETMNKIFVFWVSDRNTFQTLRSIFKNIFTQVFQHKVGIDLKYNPYQIFRKKILIRSIFLKPITPHMMFMSLVFCIHST